MEISNLIEIRNGWPPDTEGRNRKWGKETLELKSERWVGLSSEGGKEKHPR